MKVGIITYHRAHNYGAVLQAYALKRYLTSLSCEVDLIDYWPDYRVGMYDLVDLRFLDARKGLVFKVLSGCKSLSKLLMTYPLKKKRFDGFKSFISSEFVARKGQIIKNGQDLPAGYDLYIYGSDQIWRYNNFINHTGFDDVYWGKFPVDPRARKVTYAASMGVINDSPEAREFLLANVDNFSSISVRERSLGDWIYVVTGKKVNQVLDPAFLISKEDWTEISSPDVVFSEKYVLLYNLNRSAEADKLAKKLAEKHGCEVLVLDGSVAPLKFSSRYRGGAGPREFLSLFKNASFVVSTSFHGVVFSLIFEKQFFALGLEKNSARVTDLLSELNISERYLREIDSVNVDNHIDYKVVSPVLNEMRKKSMSYLDKEIQAVESSDVG